MPETQSLTYVKAVNSALRTALGDQSVIFYGEDVAKPGGIFGASKGLHDDFPDRVFDTPISETAMLGAAVGAAIAGLRPVVELMWVDFSLVALDQIVNQAANVRYVSNNLMTAPITIRTQQGALPGSCAQHSQSLEALFAHIPGLRVCLPATVQDAHDLLLAAIFCDDPTLVIEHRKLYTGAPIDITLDPAPGPIGGARVRRPGRDMTVATWGAILVDVLEAAEVLADDGIDLEVIDVRWVSPIDWATLEASINRTSRGLVVHEANITGGVGAEIAAGLSERCFFALDGPICRLGTDDLRIPAAPSLQAAALPDCARIVETVRSMLR